MNTTRTARVHRDYNEITTRLRRDYTKANAGCVLLRHMGYLSGVNAASQANNCLFSNNAIQPVRCDGYLPRSVPRYATEQSRQVQPETRK